jgi:ATP-binding cassette subfamily G (WHITE) protein 2 (PDR)
LDPNSDTFNAKAWLSNLVGFTNKDRYLSRSTGVALENLEAMALEALPNIKRMLVTYCWSTKDCFAGLEGGHKKQRKQILKGFDGVNEAGEMLLVLSSPGAGCPTLLKILSGDTHGFFIGLDSVIGDSITMRVLFQ